MKDLAISIYSVNHGLQEDYLSTICALSEIGYTGLEFIRNLYGTDPAKIREVMDETGLNATSAHIAIPDLTPTTFDILKVLGVNSIFVPSLKFPVYNERVAEILGNQLLEGKKIADSYGMSFGYHNHAYEFTTLINGKPLLYFYKDYTKGSGITFEIDVYWAEIGGFNCIQVLNDFKDCLGGVHLKDIQKETGVNVPTGTGDIDFGKVLEVADSVGCKKLIVENEPKHKTLYKSSYAMLDMQGAADCYQGLKRLL